MFDQDSILSILFSRPNWICELFNLKYLKQIWPYISLLALPDVMLQVVILIVATKYAAKDTSLVTLSFSGDYFGDFRSWNLTFGWVGFGVLLYNVFFYGIWNCKSKQHFFVLISHPSMWLWIKPYIWRWTYSSQLLVK